MGKKAKRAKDKYYNLAKAQGLRARSAFKLIQIDKKYSFLSTAQVVLDLCAAPGGWLQVASKYTPVSSLIIGVDLLPIKHIPNVITHVQDITTTSCRQVLKKDLGTRKADVVLHDGAPNVGATWSKDAYNQSELVLHSLKLAVEFMRPGGLFVTKVFRSADYHSLMWVFNQLFERVEATKPVSSRSASAEIFVVCQGFTAPSRIDPKLLSAHHVFKELDGPDGPGAKVVDVMHAKAGVQKRNREGYDPALGQTLHRKTPISEFVNSVDPVRVLSEANQLLFDSPELASHSSTTAEIRSYCEDLKVLGKADFKLLLKWRSGILRERQFARKAAAAEAVAAAEAEAGPPAEKTEAELAEEAEARAEAELAAAVERVQAKAKRVKKKEAREKMKQLRRKALGIDGNAVDVQDDPMLFSLAGIKNAEDLDAVVNVNLDEVGEGAVGGLGASDSEDDGPGATILSSEAETDDSDDSGDESDEDAVYQRILEEQLDRDYRAYTSKRKSREAAPVDRPGIKLSRRERMEQEAKQLQEQFNNKVDFEHQQYLRMLADAGAAKFDPDASDSDDDDGFFDKPDAPAAGAGLLRSAEDLAPGQARGVPSASGRAARWFSQPQFEDIEADLAVEGLAHGRSAVGDDLDSDDSDASGAGAGLGVLAPGRTLDSDPEADSDDDEVDPLAGLPISERQRRKDRLKRAAEKKAVRDSRQRKIDGGGLEVVAAEFSASDDEAPLTEKQLETQALIKAGMGATLDKPGAKTKGIEVVPAGAGKAADVDPRFLDYDSDTHAEMLALGMMMRKHTTAKALVDASYNRYSFDDPALPKWFVDDEKHNFRPQLPITREQVDAIKDQFREIVARPIKKVAEARARKKGRMMKKLDKAKAASEALATNSDLSEAAKLKAIGRMYSRARAAGAASTQKNNTPLDARLRSDKRGLKKAESKALGKKRVRTSASTGRGKNKKRHKKRR